MEAAGLTTSPAATPNRQRRRPGAHRRRQAANTTRAYRSGWAAWQRWAAEHGHQTMPAAPAAGAAYLPAPRQRRYHPHGTRSDQRTAPPGRRRRSVQRAWCRYSRACRAAAAARCRTFDWRAADLAGRSGRGRCRSRVGALAPGRLRAVARSSRRRSRRIARKREIGRRPPCRRTTHGTSLQHAALSPSSATRRAGSSAAPQRKQAPGPPSAALRTPGGIQGGTPSD